MKSIKTTWCPGCGNFGILRAFINVIEKLNKEGIEKGKIVVSSGIGCHGKISDYLDLPSFHVIHGRVLPFLTGLKLANPELKAVGFVGDGDQYNEGIEHLIHAAKRNVDLALFVHNNGVFGLTTGQMTATTPRGKKTRSTPKGNPEYPINPLLLALSSGATFIARGYAGDMKQLEELMYDAIKHIGFAIVDILQPCVSFNNTWEFYNKNVEKLEKEASDIKEAIDIILSEKIYTGIIYRIRKDTFEESLGILKY